MPRGALSSLHHHIDEAWLQEAWRRTRKDGASGVDGQSAQQYAENLQGNLADLLDRFKSGRYQAPPVRRVNIPKGDGKSTRPIGIPTLEDKVMQRAIVMLLEPIYEAEFKPHSFGFRPGKSAHDALEHLWKQSMGTWGERPVKWILDVDIKAFFDTLDHTHLRYGLTLHPEKTRLVEFKPTPRRTGKSNEDNHDQDQEPPAQGPKHQARSFDFLGFTHHWGQSRKGKLTVQRKTASKKLSKSLSSLRQWMAQHRHEPVKEQWRILRSKVQGHHNYYGITGNSRAINGFSYQAQNEWFKWLNRRGGKKPLTWARFCQWLEELFHWPGARMRPKPQLS